MTLLMKTYLREDAFIQLTINGSTCTETNILKVILNIINRVFCNDEHDPTVFKFKVTPY